MGVASFISSGNGYSSSVSYPANLSATLSGVMAVGATNQRDLRSEYSNYGSALDFVASSSDIDAPYTVGITTTDRTGSLGYNVGDYTNNTVANGFGGTSSASPLAAGVGALVLSLNPNLTAAQVRQTLRGTADKVGGVVYDGNGFNSQYGYGRINAFAALQSLGMQVIATTPANGVTVSAPPALVGDYTADFNFAYDQDAGDIDLTKVAVNGVSPTSYTVIDADTLQFNFSVNPVSGQGLQTYTVNAGAVKRLSNGELNGAYSGTFRYDALALAVTSTSPPVGSVIALPFTTLDLDFNEPVLGSSVQAADFAVNLGSVASTSLLDADTVRLTIAGLTSEGTLTVTVAAGGLTDIFGNGNVAFIGSYVLDFGTVPYPVPLEAKAPLGSLVYDPSVAGIIGFAGDVDTFTIVLDAGQTISVVVTPSGSTLQPTVEVRDPGNVALGLATAAGAGQRALLNTLPVATAGTYTVIVSGAGGTTGGYSAPLTLNAALELEGLLGGAVNNTLATAQDISASFIALAGTASRAAVLGAPLTGGGDGFETGNFSQLPWVTSGNANWYVTTEAAASGTYSARAGDINDSQSSTLAVTLTTGAGNVSFARRVSSESSFDFLRFSIDGTQVGAWSGIESSFTTVLFAVSAGTHTFTWSYTKDSSVSSGLDTAFIDNVVFPVADPDVYSFSLAQGDRATIVLEGLAGTAGAFQLRDAGNTLLALSAAGPTNVDQAVSNFKATAPGTNTYYVVVPATTAYNLVVTRNAAFDLEINGTFGVAQDATGQQGALGALAASGEAVATNQVVPSALANTETNSGNAWPFHIGNFSVPSMRYQQIYAASELTGGLIDVIRFRRSSGQATFTSSTMNVSIKLGYAATTVATASSTFANNIGAGNTTVYSGPLTLTSTSPNSTPQAFDIAIDVANLFNYNPAQGDLLLDISMFNSPVSGFFASTPVNHAPATTRIYFGDVNAASGQVGFDSASPGPYGLITRFDFAKPAEDWYQVSVNAGDSLNLSTLTPADGGGEFVNTLNPKIELYSPSNVLVGSGVVLGDGRNEQILHTATFSGLYRVRVLSESNSVGEYFVSIGGNTGTEQPPFQVTASNPVNGATFFASPTTYTVDLNDAVLITSVQAADLKVNGVNATAVTVVDGNTLAFTIVGGLPNGTHTVNIAAGDMFDVQGTPIQAFSATFIVDGIAPRVVATSVAPNAVLAPGSLTYQVTFSEPMNVSNVLSTGDFTLHGNFRQAVGVNYTPSSFSFNPAGTVLTLNYTGLPDDDYTLTLIAGSSGGTNITDAVGNALDGEFTGTFPSGNGVAGGNFGIGFDMDLATEAFPALTAKNPLGSLIYDPSLTRTIAFPGDADTLTLNIDPNQTISVIVTPTTATATPPGLQPRVELFDPANASLGFASAPAAGQVTGIQTLATTTGGLYRVQVSGVGSTQGLYSVQVILNAAFELEGKVVGATNNTRGTAQNLNGSFVSLDTTLAHASRGAVTGERTGDDDFYSFSLATGQSVSAALWVTSETTPLYPAARTDWATGTGPTGVEYRDLNADGNLDMIAVNSTSNSVAVRLGNGDGTFGPLVSYATLGSQSRFLAVGDTNGDGKLDVVVSSPSSNNVSLLLGNGNGTLQAATTYLVGTSPFGVTTGDLNGDGRADVVVANFGSNNVSVRLGQAGGTLGAATNFGTLGTGSLVPALGDLNGDGRLDLVVTNFNSASMSVLLGTGTGSFGAATTFAMSANPWTVRLADVNNDGRLDALAASQGASVVNVRLGTGTGSFGALSSFTSGVGGIRGLGVADVNGDGRRDVVVSSSAFASSTAVLLGTGTGSFGAAGTILTVGNSSNWLTLADVNNDGWPDVSTADFSSNTVSLRLNSFAPLALELQNGSGAVLAAGIAGATNLNRVLNYVAPAAGTYYLRVSGALGSYQTVITRNAVFDTEANNSLATAQNATGSHGALGAITASIGSAINAIDSGWLASDGTHNATNNNYFVGQASFNATLRNYATFSLPGATPTIIGAELRLFNPGLPNVGYTSPDPTETYSLYDVSASAAALDTERLAGDASGIAIHADLGSGTVYGSRVVSAADNGTTVSITLNAAAVAALNAAIGSTISLGGAITTLAGSDQQSMFGFTTGALGTVQLVLQTATEADWYKVTLGAGETVVEVETRTPADGLGEFVNTLNPKIQFFDAGGIEITPSVTILDDGRNEKFRATGLTSGATYNVKVTAEGGTTGEYFVGVTPLRTPTITVKKDDGDWGFQVNGPGWTVQTGAGYQNDYRLHPVSAPSSATNVARWVMTPSGPSAEVFASWVARPTNATNATYKIYDGATLVGTVVVDQTRSPNDVLLYGTTHAESLGTFTFATTQLRVELLTLGANGDVVADGVFDPPVGSALTFTSSAADTSRGGFWSGSDTRRASFGSEISPTIRQGFQLPKKALSTQMAARDSLFASLAVPRWPLDREGWNVRSSEWIDEFGRDDSDADEQGLDGSKADLPGLRPGNFGFDTVRNQFTALITKATQLPILPEEWLKLLSTLLEKVK